MPLRFADHPVLLIPFLLLLTSFVIPGELSLLVMGIAFMLVLYISLTSDVEVENGGVVLLGSPESKNWFLKELREALGGGVECSNFLKEWNGSGS